MQPVTFLIILAEGRKTFTVKPSLPTTLPHSAAGLSGLYLPIDADMTNARLSPNTRFAPGDRPMAAISHWGRNIVASEQFGREDSVFPGEGETNVTQLICNCRSSSFAHGTPQCGMEALQ